MFLILHHLHWPDSLFTVIYCVCVCVCVCTPVAPVVYHTHTHTHTPVVLSVMWIASDIRRIKTQRLTSDIQTCFCLSDSFLLHGQTDKRESVCVCERECVCVCERVCVCVCVSVSVCVCVCTPVAPVVYLTHTHTHTCCVVCDVNCVWYQKNKDTASDEWHSDLLLFIRLVPASWTDR